MEFSFSQLKALAESEGHSLESEVQKFLTKIEGYFKTNQPDQVIPAPAVAQGANLGTTVS